MQHAHQNCEKIVYKEHLLTCSVLSWILTQMGHKDLFLSAEESFHLLHHFHADLGNWVYSLSFLQDQSFVQGNLKQNGC